MEKALPSSTKVVVIGGGVAGCSVAYHLAKFGWKDTILLERDQLTSGTTWHAAGLVGQLGATATITKLRKSSLNLYKELEKKTELSTGLKQNGAITIASSKARLQELLRQAISAQLFDVNVEVLDKQKVKDLYPVINDQDILGGVFMPEDGQADPATRVHIGVVDRGDEPHLGRLEGVPGGDGELQLENPVRVRS